MARSTQPTVRTFAMLLGLTLAWLLFTPIGSAEAAPSFKLVVKGAGNTTTDKARKLTFTLTKGKKKVSKATVQLQYLNNGTWVTEKKVTIKKGKATTTVRGPAGVRTYRAVVVGKATSKAFKVGFVPLRFEITGSGAGHGVGLSQYGAYQLSRQGSSTAEILQHFYPGATLGTANNNTRNVKVQVFGAPTNTAKSTTITIPERGFIITGDGQSPQQFKSSGKIQLSVASGKVAAEVHLSGGSATKLPSSSRFTISSTLGSATIAGAHGSYKYGNLQATVIQGKLNIVNEVVMNTEYLYGIDEMPASWANDGGRAALGAQVVAARNFIITQALKWNPSPGGVNPACDCQVFDDERSQNYTGWAKAGLLANQPWIDAVNDTIVGDQVQVLRDPDRPGEIAETPYFASAGRNSGTGNNSEVFGTGQLPYLVSVPDPGFEVASNPYLDWKVKLTQSRAMKLFGQTEKLLDLKVADRYPGGLVKSLTATTLSGKQITVLRTSEAWRIGLGVPAPWLTRISVQ